MIKILLPFLLISFNLLSQNNVDWKILDDSNYSVQYPTNWELNQSGKIGTIFILFSPSESDQDNFKENINLSIQNLSGQKMDLETYVNLSLKQLRIMITNGELLLSERIKNGNNEFQKLIFLGDQGIFHLKFEQYYWVYKEQAYVLTFTTEKDKFVEFSEVGEKILNSFVLKK